MIENLMRDLLLIGDQNFIFRNAKNVSIRKAKWRKNCYCKIKYKKKYIYIPI